MLPSPILYIANDKAEKPTATKEKILDQLKTIIIASVSNDYLNGLRQEFNKAMVSRKNNFHNKRKNNRVL